MLSREGRHLAQMPWCKHSTVCVEWSNKETHNAGWPAHRLRQSVAAIELFSWPLWMPWQQAYWKPPLLRNSSGRPQEEREPGDPTLKFIGMLSWEPRCLKKPNVMSFVTSHAGTNDARALKLNFRKQGKKNYSNIHQSSWHSHYLLYLNDIHNGLYYSRLPN